ncbi:DUF2017 family protein [Microbacterium sp. ISL-103]|uniref:DUF2017 family protein n=1 Tax=Microbacterium sp. ISL-103 TaxID=2819156 RepID=UPI001BEB775A|nr:DUF2017 family protein [Microbacterium sp. ISL-103]MBT2476529.1 DUF2017 family protein [Microbacterium sp. ISL-103]
MTGPAVRMTMARVEGAQLVRLVDDLRELVGSERDLTDPAITRLVPDPYPDDDEASRTFRAATSDDLLDRRALDADVVRTALAEMRGDLDSMSQGEAFAEHELEIPPSDVDAWLRTLTALRLIIASRLGIEDDDDRDPEDARFGVYDWLGYRLELVIEAADELL